MKAFLKKLEESHLKKKAATFTREEIHSYLDSAADEEEKFALIIGLCGALRTDELSKLEFDDVREESNQLQITIRSSKTDKRAAGHIFVATSDPMPNRCPVRLFSQYKQQVPPSLQKGRLFLQQRKGKFTKQCHGKSWFSNLPTRVANFLKKPNAERFTGHSIRRTAATLLADSGESLTNLKRFGRWKSTSVAEGYIDDSLCVKRKFATEIQNLPTTEIPQQKEAKIETSTNADVPVYINNLKNCTVNINMFHGGQSF